LAPSPVVRNPVLTRRDVYDCRAAFVADPFMLRVKNTWYMFFEVYNTPARKGEIGLATSRDGLQWQYRRIVLAEPFHLSYPYVFHWEGDYYMVPESHRASQIRLYRARRFPEDWSYVATLLSGHRFADASLYRQDARWWLWTETNPAGSSDTLRLYWADTLAGPWREHPLSPVVVADPRLARPAGRVLHHHGRLFRFAQECYPRYGTNVRALEIIELTPAGYLEREVSSEPVLAPSGQGWNAAGMHHIDPHPLPAGGWIACVDGHFETGAQAPVPAAGSAKSIPWPGSS
jgi:hypothetical protein